jgi:hypothetical protein
VWLRLRHRAPASLQIPQKGKLKPRFYGLYRITTIISGIAYLLELPPHARLHDVFHMVILKKFVSLPSATPLRYCQQADYAAHTRLAHIVRQILVHWKGEPAASATWKDVDSFHDRYPSF